jgi:hypothetical protein
MNNTTASRRLAVGLVALAAGLALASCGDDAPEPGQSTQTAPSPTTDSGAPDPTRVPQVGSGTGLADTDYVELDQQALRTGPQTDDVDGDDPADVLERGLTAAFAWRPGTDSSQFDAVVRSSSAWNNTYLRSEETRLTTLIPMSMRDWTAWGDQGKIFYPTVKLTNETHPQDTGTDFSRVVTIDMATGSESDPADGRHIMKIIGQARVHKTEQGWRIETFQVRDTVLGEQS